MSVTGEDKGVNLERLLENVCDVLEINIKDVMGSSRLGDIIQVRRMYAALARKYSSMSYNQIGMVIKKDHATIMHHCKISDNLLETCKKYRKDFAYVETLAVPSARLEEERQKDFINTLMVRNAKLQNELLRLRDEAAILKLKLKS